MAWVLEYTSYRLAIPPISRLPLSMLVALADLTIVKGYVVELPSQSFHWEALPDPRTWSFQATYLPLPGVLAGIIPVD